MTDGMKRISWCIHIKYSNEVIMSLVYGITFEILELKITITTTITRMIMVMGFSPFNEFPACIIL
jgi:hypothetical protein